MEKNPFARETSLFGFDGNEFFIPNMHSCIGEDLKEAGNSIGKRHPVDQYRNIK